VRQKADDGCLFLGVGRQGGGNKALVVYSSILEAEGQWDLARLLVQELLALGGRAAAGDLIVGLGVDLDIAQKSFKDRWFNFHNLFFR